jgi:hypothetical protein
MLASCARHTGGVTSYGRSVITIAATGAGFMAASIAVGGFIVHVGPALTGKDEARVRAATVIGGLGGLAVAVLVIVGSVFF